MGFTAPAVHYSALATLPPGLTSSKSQQSIKSPASIRVILSEIFKKLVSNDIHSEQTITNEIVEQIQLPKTTVRLPETIEKENDTSIVVKNPNTNNSGNRTSIEQESPKSMPSLTEPLERLPFTEPYFSITPKNKKYPFELSAYHKHCIHQQKYIDQKQYHHPIKQIKTTQPNSSLLSSIKENCPALANYRLQNSTDQQHQIKFNSKKSTSTTILPVSASIENRIGFQYASQRNTITTSHGIRSSYTQQQTQRLRRLHSKSKIRPVSSDIKTSSLVLQKKCTPSSSISTSIAHRIELLKKAMHNHQLEVHHLKLEKLPPATESSSHPLIDSIHKQTQTNNNNPLKSSEIHHIHHHHIHSSSILSTEWRTYLSIIGTFFIIFLLLIELITIIF